MDSPATDSAPPRACHCRQWQATFYTGFCPYCGGPGRQFQPGAHPTVSNRIGSTGEPATPEQEIQGLLRRRRQCSEAGRLGDDSLGHLRLAEMPACADGPSAATAKAKLAEALEWMERATEEAYAEAEAIRVLLTSPAFGLPEADGLEPADPPPSWVPAPPLPTLREAVRRFRAIVTVITGNGIIILGPEAVVRIATMNGLSESTLTAAGLRIDGYVLAYAASDAPLVDLRTVKAALQTLSWPALEHLLAHFEGDLRATLRNPAYQPGGTHRAAGVCVQQELLVRSLATARTMT